jgi:hypothetical protein
VKKDRYSDGCVLPAKRLSMIRKTLFAILAIVFCTRAQNANLTAREAKEHIGEVQPVCGKVASTHYATGSNYYSWLLSVLLQPLSDRLILF